MPDKRKEKRAKNKGQWISIVIFLLIGAACGILILMYLDFPGQQGKTHLANFVSFLLLLIGMYAAMLIQIILHEAGHLIFGLLTGYRFSSFRMGQTGGPHPVQKAEHRGNRRPVLDDSSGSERRQDAGDAV